MTLRWGKVAEPWWNDRPVLVVGTGPSMKGFDFSRLRGLGYILAVKESVWDIPFADACFGLDMGWMARKRSALRELTIPLYLSVPKEFREPVIDNAIYLMRTRDREIFHTNPKMIESGGNSGFGAVNLAFLKKARMIVLFGYDYQGDHYCNDRYTHLGAGHNARYLPRWGRHFDRVKQQLARAGVSVLNASTRSTVDAFERCTPEAALERLDRIRSQGSSGFRCLPVIDPTAPNAAVAS
jgi:hypothetical protein